MSDKKFSPAYRAALASEHWRLLRERCRQETRNRCEACGKPYAPGRPLELHHLTYERLGHEERDDVILLCLQCHEEADYSRRNRTDFLQHVPGYYRQTWADDPSDDKARRSAESWWADRWQRTLEQAAELARKVGIR